MKFSLSQGAVVVTSISGPNAVLQSLAQGCVAHQSRFIVTGDTKSPREFSLEGCEFLDVEAQRKLPFAYARSCPERSYSRKNIAYLAAIAGGAKFIVETDDDNFPRDGFWEDRSRLLQADRVEPKGWINVYGHFADAFIYPRGFPLDLAKSTDAVPLRISTDAWHDCPIQQGLADENPDVDAVYRMLFPLPFNFEKRAPVVLSDGQWCPFNSQNTTIFADAYPLLYLPSHCSFRMTDIWRSFVAQRILWTCHWQVAFHSATVWQERNEHSLIKDFEDEIPGYRFNAKMVEVLAGLKLEPGVPAIPENMRRCYAALISNGWVGAEETPLLEEWLEAVEAARTKK